MTTRQTLAERLTTGSKDFQKLNANNAPSKILHEYVEKMKSERLLKSIPTESKSQQDLIRWWSFVCELYRLPEAILMAFPLQGKRGPRNGARMKAEGMRAGTPDLFLAVARNGYHGLWLELKREKGGVLSEAQREQIKLLLEHGYLVKIAKGFEEANGFIEEYLMS